MAQRVNVVLEDDLDDVFVAEFERMAELEGRGEQLSNRIVSPGKRIAEGRSGQ